MAPGTTAYTLLHLEDDKVQAGSRTVAQVVVILHKVVGSNAHFDVIKVAKCGIHEGGQRRVVPPEGNDAELRSKKQTMFRREGHAILKGKQGEDQEHLLQNKAN